MLVKFCGFISNTIMEFVFKRSFLLVIFVYRTSIIILIITIIILNFYIVGTNVTSKLPTRRIIFIFLSKNFLVMFTVVRTTAVRWPFIWLMRPKSRYKTWSQLFLFSREFDFVFCVLFFLVFVIYVWAASYGSVYIQSVYKWMVHFQKLTRNLFLTLHGQNVHR